MSNTDIESRAKDFANEQGTSHEIFKVGDTVIEWFSPFAGTLMTVKRVTPRRVYLENGHKFDSEGYGLECSCRAYEDSGLFRYQIVPYVGDEKAKYDKQVEWDRWFKVAQAINNVDIADTIPASRLEEILEELSGNRSEL
jgi:hypothetical protein